MIGTNCEKPAFIQSEGLVFFFDISLLMVYFVLFLIGCFGLQKLLSLRVFALHPEVSQLVPKQSL